MLFLFSYITYLLLLIVGHFRYAMRTDWYLFKHNNLPLLWILTKPKYYHAYYESLIEEFVICYNVILELG